MSALRLKGSLSRANVVTVSSEQPKPLDSDVRSKPILGIVSVILDELLGLSAMVPQLWRDWARVHQGYVG